MFGQDAESRDGGMSTLSFADRIIGGQVYVF